MLGILYLFLCIGVGWLICSIAYPNLATLAGTDCYKRRIELSPLIILFPAWFAVGVLAMTWPVYILAYIFRSKPAPLIYANLIVMSLAGLILILMVARSLLARKTAGNAACGGIKLASLLCRDKRVLR